MAAVIERTARIVAIPRFLSPVHLTRDTWWMADMDWFGFYGSIPALVRGIDHQPMSGVGASLLTTHAIAEYRWFEM